MQERSRRAASQQLGEHKMARLNDALIGLLAVAVLAATGFVTSLILAGGGPDHTAEASTGAATAVLEQQSAQPEPVLPHTSSSTTSSLTVPMYGYVINGVEPE
jgi:hypothetical protein